MTEADSGGADKGVPGSGARPALAGFAYQVDVSVFAALDLLLMQRSARSVILEPANSEDIVGIVNDHTPDTTEASGAMSEGYQLIIQVKRKTGGPWRVKSFTDLLNHGKRRKSAKANLEDQKNRYLLITSAAVTDSLRPLLIEEFGAWPEPGSLTGSLLAELGQGVDTRIAIWESLSDYVLDHKISDILTKLRVPLQQWENCKRKLREEADARMQGASAGHWMRGDLETLIRSFGGSLASSPLLEKYVRPGNWDELTQKLKRTNAVLIKGPSGTGKTLTAHALSEWARARNSHLTIHMSSDMDRLRGFNLAGPTLFHVDDPWGQSTLRPGAETVGRQMQAAFADARAECCYIVTSRTDVLGLAHAEAGLEDWSVTLDSGSYEEGQLAKIYEKHLNALPPQYQQQAYDYRSTALEKLKTPFEVRIFFNELSRGPRAGEDEWTHRRRAIELAHRDAVAGVVVSDLVQDRYGWHPILWALFGARSNVRRSTLAQIQQVMRRTKADYKEGLTPLVNFLVSARHLRQFEDVVSFAHPSVRDGFEARLIEDSFKSIGAVQALLEVLTALSGDLAEWGKETAAGVVRLAASQFGDDFQCPEGVQQVIDAWLTAGLVDPHSHFEELLSLAAAVSSGDCPVGNLARWLVDGFQTGGRVFDDNWRPPQFPPSMFDGISRDRDCHLICDRFVRNILPNANDRYGNDFAQIISAFGGDLDEAFLDAAMQVAKGSHYANAETIASAAIKNLPKYEPILAEALRFLRPDEVQEAQDAETWQRIQNHELDAGAEDWFIDSRQEDFGPEQIAGTYVERVREDGRWDMLSIHPHNMALLGFWVDAVRRDKAAVAPAELGALLELAKESAREQDAWRSAACHWDDQLAPLMLDRLAGGQSDAELSAALAESLVTVAHHLIPEAIKSIGLEVAQRLAFILDMTLAIQQNAEKTVGVGEILAQCLSPEELEFLDKITLGDEPSGQVGQATLAMLNEAIPGASPALIAQIVRIENASGRLLPDTLIAALDRAGSPDKSKAAVDLAERVGACEVVRGALSHRYADAREAALLALARTASTPLPGELLAMAKDKSSRVRRTLVRLLAARPDAAHREVLWSLVKDTWSASEPHHDEPPSYAIAREAIAALNGYGPFDEQQAIALIDEGAVTQDPELRQVAFRAAAANGPPSARYRLQAIALEEQLNWVVIYAIDALGSAPFLEPDILENLQAASLLEGNAILLASRAVLLGRHGEIGRVLRVFEEVARSSKARALLLLGAVALVKRDPASAEKLLQFLPPGHPCRQIFALADDQLLPSDCLNELGRIRIRTEVLFWLARGISPPAGTNRYFHGPRMRFDKWW